MKTFKTIYLTVMILTTICVVGLFGTRRFMIFKGWFSDADIVKESVQVEPFKEIILDADVADFTIVEGEEYRVDYEYPSNIAVKGKVENEVLNLSVIGKKNTGYGLFEVDGKGINTVDTKLTVVVPKGSEVKVADLTIRAGQIRLSDRDFDTLKADCAAGNLDLKKVKADKLEVKADAGNVEIDDSTFEDAKFTLATGALNVEDSVIGNLEAQNNMGTLTLYKTNFTKGTLESNLGKVDVDGEFEELKIVSNLGGINVDSENIENAKLDLSVDLGDIIVNGEKKTPAYTQN